MNWKLAPRIFHAIAALVIISCLYFGKNSFQYETLWACAIIGWGSHLLNQLEEKK